MCPDPQVGRGGVQDLDVAEVGAGDGDGGFNDLAEDVLSSVGTVGATDRPVGKFLDERSVIGVAPLARAFTARAGAARRESEPDCEACDEGRVYTVYARWSRHPCDMLTFLSDRILVVDGAWLDVLLRGIPTSRIPQRRCWPGPRHLSRSTSSRTS